MKNLLFILFLLPAFYLSQLRVQADIRGRSCGGGLGICSSTSFIEKNKTAKSEESKFILTKVDENHLVFQTSLSDLSIAEQNSMIGKSFASVSSNEIPYFTQEVDLSLDYKTLSSLKIASKFNKIKSGKYPVTINKDQVFVRFTISE